MSTSLAGSPAPRAEQTAGIRSALPKMKKASSTKPPYAPSSARRAGAGSPGSGDAASPEPRAVQLQFSLEGIAEDEENHFLD